MDVLERFLNYVKIDTNSNDDNMECPSSRSQWDLANMLVDEMKEIGIADARVDEHCYVYGTIPATDETMPAIGLIAHMDTSSQVPGGPVKARVIRYEGGDICLNEEKQIVMREKDYETLKQDRGSELVITDGNTLLGADDKAGIAAIMAAAENLIKDGTRPHGKICLGFTPDEEVGRGADLFDVEHFGADFAYTVDGGDLSELEYENFNAASARVTVKGVSIHPGSAKNKMVNSITVAMEFNALLPAREIPENTEGYEGFHLLNGITGDVSETKMHYILRDHDLDKLNRKKEDFLKAAAFLNDRYGEKTVQVELKNSYYNMRSLIEEDMSIVKRAEEAVKSVGLIPVACPIRGGTDGARLSYMGLKCPNLGAGGRNFHGVFEYLNADQLRLCVKVLEKIVTTK